MLRVTNNNLSTVIAVIVLVSGLVGCQARQDSIRVQLPNATEQATPPRPLITEGIDWLSEGYVDPIEQVIHDQAEFGITTPNAIFYARSADLPVVAIAIWENNQRVLFSSEAQITHDPDSVNAVLNALVERYPIQAIDPIQWTTLYQQWAAQANPRRVLALEQSYTLTFYPANP